MKKWLLQKLQQPPNMANVIATLNKLHIRDGQQLSTVEREISIVKAAVLDIRF